MSNIMTVLGQYARINEALQPEQFAMLGPRNIRVFDGASLCPVFQVRSEMEGTRTWK
jgi:hypothetical protein